MKDQQSGERVVADLPDQMRWFLAAGMSAT
jgi:hypothetical protein